jgi:hypothetical protein
LGGKPQTATPGEELAQSLAGSVARIQALGSTLTVTELNAKAAAYHAGLELALDNTDWIKRFPGRSILSRFVGRVFGGKIDPLLFSNAVLDKMTDKRVRPASMQRVFEEILKLN